MRRRLRQEEPVNHDRWMISYADFMTVLFALFVVLFASLNQNGHSIKTVSKAIHHGFVELEPFSGGADSSEMAQPQLRPDRSTISLPGLREDDANTLSGIDIEALRRELEAAIGEELHNGQVTMEVTPDGFVISLKELGFFHSGQAALRPGAADKIEQIAKVLSQHGFHLRVEGHSDIQPIHTAAFDSNWQLSTARAMAVLMFLIKSGLDPGKISVAGYGPYRPISDNASAEGRKMNRRVDLVVLFGVDPQRRPH